MNEPSKRRWLRFRLSTVLILTAILAWGMATRPWYVDISRFSRVPSQTTPTHAFGVYVDGQRGPKPKLLRPATALFAFLTWKTACAVVEFRRGKVG